MSFVSFEECELVGISWLDFASGTLSFPIEKFEKCLLKYDLFENMNLKKFNFSGSVLAETSFLQCDLSGSSFYGCTLSRTDFSSCDLRNADFKNAVGYDIDVTANKMRGAKFSSPDALNLLRHFGIVIEENEK